MKYVGRPVLGLETPTLVSGHGTYVADLQLPGMCAAAMLRSPYAHARLIAIDTSKAEAASRGPRGGCRPGDRTEYEPDAAARRSRSVRRQERHHLCPSNLPRPLRW